MAPKSTSKEENHGKKRRVTQRVDGQGRADGPWGSSSMQNSGWSVPQSCPSLGARKWRHMTFTPISHHVRLLPEREVFPARHMWQKSAEYVGTGQCGAGRALLCNMYMLTTLRLGRRHGSRGGTCPCCGIGGQSRRRYFPGELGSMNTSFLGKAGSKPRPGWAHNKYFNECQRSPERFKCLS